MSKWFVRVPVYADAVVVVEAATEAEAVVAAVEQCSHPLCTYCADRYEIGDQDASSEVTAESFD